jgi:hypothetical protein
MSVARPSYGMSINVRQTLRYASDQRWPAHSTRRARHLSDAQCRDAVHYTRPALAHQPAACHRDHGVSARVRAVAYPRRAGPRCESCKSCKSGAADAGGHPWDRRLCRRATLSHLQALARGVFLFLRIVLNTTGGVTCLFHFHSFGEAELLQDLSKFSYKAACCLSRDCDREFQSNAQARA